MPNQSAYLVNTNGTGKIPDEQILECVQKVFDMTPYGIITTLNLRRPIYKKTAAFGHFGRDDVEFPWERCDKVELLKKEAECCKKA